MIPDGSGVVFDQLAGHADLQVGIGKCNLIGLIGVCAALYLGRVHEGTNVQWGYSGYR